jgi:hypothetical protein
MSDVQKSQVLPTPIYKEEYLINRGRQHSATQITCPKYEGLEGSKRCRHYADGGACSLPDELMCIEWLRANGHAFAPASTPSLPMAREPFRLEVQQAAPALRAVTAPPAVHVGGERQPMEAIPADDIAAFKAVGVEVQLDIGSASVHLVPEYTNQNRIELSIEHAATLRRLLDAFPGARVAHIARTTSSGDNRHGSPADRR